MLRKIRVKPLADESFGVRSMCTFVETDDVKVLLDPGASLAPNRMGHPPHPREYNAMAESREKISEVAKKAEVVTISHYHFDHHTPSYTDWFCNWSSKASAKRIYSGKLVLAKSFRSQINSSQRRRGWVFKKTGGSYAKRVLVADGKSFQFGDTKLMFSEPVFHGPEDSPLGWILMTTIENSDEKIMFAPDVQGPMYNPTKEKILAESPQLLIIGGPPAYLAGFKVDCKHIEKGMKNLKSLVNKVPIIILEHHILRDCEWEKLFQPIFSAASRLGHKLVTAAEFEGKKNNFLEFHRRKLFEDDPPSPEFRNWVGFPKPKRRLIRPPI